ncbi:site-specific integrase [Synechococcus sp. PROS-U-1]|uniref:site-specific integrase n=1 Tax=Synechococcus sp. PROS-U-1 TaxID=1400866 RepID=UPI001861DD4C|nr:site-specific integrase [Synechococcus sp. PROS-U-1]QNJ03716.1 phage integrase [Synechococcus sp. PROS-U-1]
MRLAVDHNGHRQTVTLPYGWTEEGAAAALPRIQQIAKRFGNGDAITLAKAAQGAETSSSNQKLNILKLAEEFRKTRPTCNDDTWKNKYQRAINNIRDCLEGKNKPKDGTDLCQQALEQWEHGSRQRQVMRQAAYSFLRWGVERGHLKPCYLPPEAEPEVKRPKRVGYPLSDAQILRLLDSLPKGEQHTRWRFGLQLMAVYGIRPEELRWLRIKDDQLWSFYRKSQGGRNGAKTEPRRLYPLLVRDIDGTPIDWNLQARIQINEELPPLNGEGEGGNAVGTYLKRRTTWNSMRMEAEQISEQLTPYSFRHRYAKRSHAMNLPIANICAAMGHTIEVHLKSYARFKPDSTQDLYAAANAR